jgi:hypothetical protein
VSRRLLLPPANPPSLDAAQVEGRGGNRRGAGRPGGPLLGAPPPHRGRRLLPGRQSFGPRSSPPSTPSALALTPV